MSETPTGALAMGVYVHVAELDKAKAEIKRLRAALEEIADENGGCNDYPPGGCDSECEATARRALKETR